MIGELRTHVGATKRPCARELAHARTILLLLASFLAGLAVSAFWFYQSPRHGPAGSAANHGRPSVVLSEATRAALHRLEGPIELRFYSLLDPASVPASVQAFARRVDQLLAAYQEEAKGKINLIRFASASGSNANSAIADGVKPFNLDKGDACFLGIAVSRDGHKESLPELAPEWEQALEPDLTRAILRVANASTQARPTLAAAAKPDPGVIESVKRALPNLASVSVAEGTRVLREAALKEFTEAAQQMQAQVKEAQERLAQARNGGSDAEQQAAIKQLQQVQTEQSEKLKEIAARSKAQIDALQQLKASAR
jgi:hypothetical protein